MNTNFRDIGVALIGTGFMAQVHTDALRRVGVRLVGILGSTPQKSADAAARLGYERGYSDLDDLLTDPEVHAVHVNTPNRHHLPQTLAALSAGKHVLCEKPLGMDSDESSILLQTANAFPELATAVNYNNRFYALCQEARERLKVEEKREKGEGRENEASPSTFPLSPFPMIHHVTGSVTQDWLLYDTDYNWRVLSEEQGRLRALADIGAHWLDLVHFVTGLEIESVCADFATVHPVRQRPLGEIETFSSAAGGQTEPIAIATDDYGAVLLRFVGGARGCFFVSQVSAGRKYRVSFEVAARDQTLAWNSEDCETIWIGRRDGPSAMLRRDPARVPAGVSDYPAGHAEGYPDSFTKGFARFYEWIAAKDLDAPKHFATFADGHRDNVLCDAFVKSVETKGWVKV